MKSFFSLVVISILLIGSIAIYTTQLSGKNQLVPVNTIRFSGVIVAQKVVVSTKNGGRLGTLKVKEGDWVTAGDEVAIMDNVEVKAQRNAQLAQINQIEARLRQLRENVTLERERLAGQLMRAEAQLQIATNQRDQATAELEQHRADERRARNLVGKSLVSEQDVERLATEVRVAEARLKSLDSQINSAKADLVLARANQRQETIAAGEVAQAEAQLQVARSQLAEIESRLADTVIKAPLAGMVTVVVAHQGEIIRMGDPIVTIVDLDDIWLKTEVEETYVSRLTVGMPATVMLLDGTEIAGHITFISPEPEFATQRDIDRMKRDIRTFGIRIAVPNSARRLHPGMTAYAFLPE